MEAQQKGTIMKKVLFAFITVLALCGTVEARNLAHHEVQEHSIIDDILGTPDGNWGVSPRIRGPIRHEIGRAHV